MCALGVLLVADAVRAEMQRLTRYRAIRISMQADLSEIQVVGESKRSTYVVTKVDECIGSRVVGSKPICIEPAYSMVR